MEIGSGIFSGQKLYTIKGNFIRPTSTKIRQAIFNMIRDKIAGAVIFDFFAGTGAFGLEAISNGAKFVVFIEKNYKNLILKNILKLKLNKEKFKILGCDFEKGIKILKKLNIKANIIFSDPPYNKGYIKKFLQLLKTSDILIKDGYIILQIDKKEYIENNNIILNEFNIEKEKKYGNTIIIILRIKNENG